MRSSLSPSSSEGEALASEYAIGRQLGVSRTTVRKVLAALGERGVVIAGPAAVW